MCGRYANSRRPEDLVEEYRIDSLIGDGPGTDPSEAEPDFNLAPTKTAPVVLERRPRPVEDVAEDVPLDAVDDDGEVTADAALEQAQIEATERADDARVRWLRTLTWGLVPSWSKDRTGGARMINARAETLLDRTFRRSALTRRCLVPADGWYEWQASPTERDAKGKPRKQPFFLHAHDGSPIAFAGIYEFWRDRSADAGDHNAWLTTFSIITVAAEPGLDLIHDRMPLVLPSASWDEWLDPSVVEEDSVRAMLVPPSPGRFAAYPVTTAVNSATNNGAHLLDAAPVESLQGVLDPATGELIGGSGALF